MTFFTTYVLYPIIAKTIYQKHSEELSKLKSIKKKIENAELLTMEESQKIRSLHKTLEVERDSLRQQLQNHIDIINSNKISHQTKIEHNESELKRLKEENQKLEDRVNKREYGNYTPIDYIEEILLSESLNDFIKFYEEYFVQSADDDDNQEDYKNFTKELKKLIQEKMKDKKFMLFLTSYKLGDLKRICDYNSNRNIKTIILNKDLCVVLYREVKKRQL
jgi:hypothetical protein